MAKKILTQDEKNAALENKYNPSYDPGLDAVKATAKKTNPESWAAEGSTLAKPSKEWADWVDKEGKAAGFRGAKSPKKIAKKPYKRK